ncbi:hypothetical protein TWF696_001346 [Orbilia brochopaga]|uniref:Uncharacterized protein n=1 Tax=Orbilia brochopaga TaxID=3140254 RepID=A0AAV9U8Q0_9PEZI
MSEPKRVKLSYRDPRPAGLEDDSDSDSGSGWENASENEDSLSSGDASDFPDDSPYEEMKWRQPQLSDYKNYELAKTLHGLLDKADSYLGNFAFNRSFPENPSPGLRVNTLGTIGMPISPRDAEMLYRHGRALSTTMSEKDGVAEIPATEFGFRNPVWKNWLDGVVYKVELELGIGDEDSLKLKLEKLVIYAPGGDDAGFAMDWSSTAVDRENIIGYLEVVLPGEFTGGSVTLSYEQKAPAEEVDQEMDSTESAPDTETREIHFQGDSHFDTVVAAWYSDVKHQTANITMGYKTTLIYTLYTLSPPKTPTLRFTQSSAIARTLKALPHLTDRSKEPFPPPAAYDPILYVLEGHYCELAHFPMKDKTFLPHDRIKMQNIIHAIKNVKGLSLYTGVLETDDPYRKVPAGSKRWYNGAVRTVDNDAPSDPLDYEDRHKEFLSNTLRNMRHLAGPVRDMDDHYWHGPVLTFGPKLSKLQEEALALEKELLEEDDGWDEEEMEKLQKVACIVIWPTSTLESIEMHEPVRNMRKSWKQIKEFFRSMPCAHDGDEDGYIKARLNTIMQFCFNGELTEDQLFEARDMVEQILADAPPDTRSDIFRRYGYEKFSFTHETPVDLLNAMVRSSFRDDSGPDGPNFTVLERRLKLMEIFPRQLFPSCLKGLSGLVRQRDYLCHGPAHLVRSVFTVLNWKEELLAAWLRSIFMANPSENFRRAVDDDMKHNLEEGSDSLKVWVSISQKSHEYIIEGIKERFPRLLSEIVEKQYPRNVVTDEPQENPHRIEMLGYTIQLDPDRDPAEVIGIRLANYLECLLDQADSASLMTQLFDAIKIPATEDSECSNKRAPKPRKTLYGSFFEMDSTPKFYRNSELLTVLFQVAMVVSKLLSPSETKTVDAEASAVLSQFTAYFKDLVEEIYPCEKPPDSMPSLSLPPLRKRCKKPECHICPAVNNFLRSPDAETLTLRCPDRLKSHVLQIKKLFPDPPEDDTSVPEIRDIACVWALESEGRFRGQGKIKLEKQVIQNYHKQKAEFAEKMAERKKWLEPLGLPAEDHGKTLGKATKSVEKSGKKRKASVGAVP